MSIHAAVMEASGLDYEPGQRKYFISTLEPPFLGQFFNVIRVFPLYFITFQPYEATGRAHLTEKSYFPHNLQISYPRNEEEE